MTRDLFNAPYQSHSVTSREAAEAIAPKLHRLQQKVFDFLILCERSASRGATDEQMQFALSLNPSTQRPRRIELVDKGLVIDSGRTALTKSGCKAVVWAVKR